MLESKKRRTKDASSRKKHKKSRIDDNEDASNKIMDASAVSLASPRTLDLSKNSISKSPRASFGLAQSPNTLPQLPSQSPLHQRWLSTANMKELEAKGVVIKAGPFSASEDEMLKKTVDDFLKHHGLTVAHLPACMRKKPGGTVTAGTAQVSEEVKSLFWGTISKPFPQRPLRSIYYRLMRLYHPANSREAWTLEEIVQLRSLVNQFGRNWQQIGAALGRMPENCRTKYRAVEQRAPPPALPSVNVDDTVGNSNQPPQEAEEKCETDSSRWFAEDEIKFIQAMLSFVLNNPNINTTTTKIKVSYLLDWMDSHDFTMWDAAANKYNALKPYQLRNYSDVRVKWHRSLPMLRLELDARDPNEEVTIEELHRALLPRREKYVWSPDEDRVLLQRLKELYPKANYLGDIKWVQVEQFPEFRYKTSSLIASRFRRLVKYIIPRDDPLRVHITRRKRPLSDQESSKIKPVRKLFKKLLRRLDKHENSKKLYGRRGRLLKQPSPENCRVLTPTFVQDDEDNDSS